MLHRSNTRLFSLFFAQHALFNFHRDKNWGGGACQVQVPQRKGGMEIQSIAPFTLCVKWHVRMPPHKIHFDMGVPGQQVLKIWKERGTPKMNCIGGRALETSYQIHGAA